VIKREVEFLGYHTSICPRCGEEIFIPMYRLRPGTIEDLQRYKDEVLEMERREAKERKKGKGGET